MLIGLFYLRKLNANLLFTKRTNATKAILNYVFLVNYLEAIIMLRTKLGAAVLLSVISTGAFAGQCDVAIEATASMAFSLKEIAVSKTCKEVSLTFKNVGTMAKAMMGHNVVISKKSTMQAVLTDGSAAGLAKNYVKDNDDRVIAHTVVIGGGETTNIKFKVSSLDAKEAYVFYCSFPGHAGVMNGVFKLL
jgi:azurin